MGNLIKVGSCSICVPVGNVRDRDDNSDSDDDSEYGSDVSGDSNPSSNDDLETIRQKIQKEKDKAKKLKQKAKTEKKLRKKLERQWSADIQTTHSYHNDTDADMSILSGAQSNRTPNHIPTMGQQSSREFIEIIDESPQFHWRENKYNVTSVVDDNNDTAVMQTSATVSQNSRTVSNEETIEPEYNLNVSESKRQSKIRDQNQINPNMDINMSMTVPSKKTNNYHNNLPIYNHHHPNLNTSMSFTHNNLLPTTTTQLYQQTSAPHLPLHSLNVSRFVSPNMMKHRSQPIQPNGFFSRTNTEFEDEKDSFHVMSDYESEIQQSVSNKSYKVNTNVNHLKIVTNMSMVNEAKQTAGQNTNNTNTTNISTPIISDDLKKKVLNLENDKSDMETELLAMKSMEELKKMGITPKGYRISKRLSQKILGIDPRVHSNQSQSDTDTASTSMSSQELERIQMHKQRESMLLSQRIKKNSKAKLTVKNNHLSPDDGLDDGNDSDFPRNLMRIKSAEEWTADELESTELALKANYIDIINGTCK